MDVLLVEKGVEELHSEHRVDEDENAQKSEHVAHGGQREDAARGDEEKRGGGRGEGYIREREVRGEEGRSTKLVWAASGWTTNNTNDIRHQRVCTASFIGYQLSTENPAKLTAKLG